MTDRRRRFYEWFEEMVDRAEEMGIKLEPITDKELERYAR